MMIDRKKKSIAILEHELFKDNICPECGKDFTANGTGPTKSRWITAFLQGTPSELILGGTPARFHDYAYLLCPAGWTLYMAKPCGNGTVKANSKSTSDRAYFDLMIDSHKDSKGLAKLMLWALAKRNYLAVKLGGGPSYRHSHD